MVGVLQIQIYHYLPPTLTITPLYCSFYVWIGTEIRNIVTDISNTNSIRVSSIKIAIFIIGVICLSLFLFIAYKYLE
jgi:hypothetical protein